MSPLKYTLVSEGGTDRNLIPIINWTLREVGKRQISLGQRAEFWRLQSKPTSLREKLVKACELYPCEVLFVHRDSDNVNPAERNAEIREAREQAKSMGITVPAVAIVPVRMLEAWLLFDEKAIRKASGNPNGEASLALPSMSRVESRPDPKADLHSALEVASELSGRRLKKFSPEMAFWRILDYIEDFSPLRQLPAYKAFESSVQRGAEENWSGEFYGNV